MPRRPSPGQQLASDVIRALVVLVLVAGMLVSCFAHAAR